MNKVICRQLEMIHISDIEKMESEHIELKSDKKFLRLLMEGNADYTNQIKQSDAGTISNETINAKIRYQSDLPFINTALKYYVLRLRTDSGSFIVGSIDYPAELTYSDNKVFINLTFKASKPV